MNKVKTNITEFKGATIQNYTGAELVPGIAYKTFGDSTAIYNIIVTRGEADVPIEHMVDLEDVIEDSPIYSEDMLNFIIEIIGCTDLEKLVFIQRYFIRLIGEFVEDFSSSIYYKGDDIMFEDGKKMSVSIATISKTSGLIHIGLNVSGTKYPKGVEAASLLDILPNEDALEVFIENVVGKMRSEINDIFIATTKVITR